MRATIQQKSSFLPSLASSQGKGSLIQRKFNPPDSGVNGIVQRQGYSSLPVQLEDGPEGEKNKGFVEKEAELVEKGMQVHSAVTGGMKTVAAIKKAANSNSSTRERVHHGLEAVEHGTETSASTLELLDKGHDFVLPLQVASKGAGALGHFVDASGKEGDERNKSIRKGLSDTVQGGSKVAMSMVPALSPAIWSGAKLASSLLDPETHIDPIAEKVSDIAHGRDSVGAMVSRNVNAVVDPIAEKVSDVAHGRDSVGGMLGRLWESGMQTFIDPIANRVSDFAHAPSKEANRKRKAEKEEEEIAKHLPIPQITTTTEAVQPSGN